MRIAIYTGNVLGDEWQEMVEQLFLKLAIQRNQDEFIFITHQPIDDKCKLVKNCSNVLVPFKTNNAFLFKYWYQRTFSFVLKKNRINLLLNASNVYSLRTKMPQILYLKDLSFLLQAKMNFKKRILGDLAKADAIVVGTQFSKKELVENNSIMEEKITVVKPFAGSIFQPIDWREKQAVKEKYSDGKEYFLVSRHDVSTIDWMMLLKAFSLFKKRQLSNMQLVILGGMKNETADLTKKMASYKFRDDVKWLADMPEKEQTAIFAAAYCLVQMDKYDGLALPLLRAMQSGVPSIAPNTGDIAEMTAGAILYADVSSPESIAEQMKIIYKDENLRSQMITSGLIHLEGNTGEDCSSAMWTCIQKVMD